MTQFKSALKVFFIYVFYSLDENLNYCLMPFCSHHIIKLLISTVFIYM